MLILKGFCFILALCNWYRFYEDGEIEYFVSANIWLIFTICLIAWGD